MKKSTLFSTALVAVFCASFIACSSPAHEEAAEGEAVEVATEAEEVVEEVSEAVDSTAAAVEEGAEEAVEAAEGAE